MDEALEEVDLQSRGRDRVATYSMGMKQRLGVAAALLKQPELLILDEPANGLDPQGMVEMRTLLRTLGHGDKSVLVSSHLLGEVEQICDRVRWQDVDSAKSADSGTTLSGHRISSCSTPQRPICACGDRSKS